jgi:hypothetical protein
VDTTGFWVGTWSADEGQDDGTILLDMDQAGSAVEGRVKLIADLPDLANMGVEFEGQVTSDRLQFELGPAHAPVSFEGVSTGDQISGQFDTPESSGTWSVDLSGTESLEVSSSIVIDMESPTAVAYDASQYWIRDSNGVVRNADLEGSLHDTIQLSDWCLEGFALDDAAFYCTNGGHEGVQRFDRTSGEWLDERVTPGFMPGEIALDGESLRAFHWITNDLATLNDGEVTLFERVPGKSDAIVLTDDRVWSINSFPNALVELDQDGHLLEAYRLPCAMDTWDRILSMTFDGDYFWLLLEEAVDPEFDTSGAADHFLVSISVPG